MFLITNIAMLSGLFAVLAIVLVIAEQFLINYGECRLTINDADDEEKTVAVDGGVNLLDSLLEAGVEVQHSCGGRGSCGFCKVRVSEGGGEVAPTEKPFLTRQDIASGMRLACQVRVRNNIKVDVPDFLEVVEDMVRSGTYDDRAQWRFSIKGEENEPF